MAIDYQTLPYWLPNLNWLANYTQWDDVTQDWLANLLNNEVSTYHINLSTSGFI